MLQYATMLNSCAGGLKRRSIVLAAAATASICAAQVPKRALVRRVGVLLSDGPPESSPTPLEQKLRELSAAGGMQVEVEVHFGARAELRRQAETLAASNVDLIVASGTPAALFAHRATQSIPIVYVIAGDPVALGLAASLVRPGGNSTGIYGLNTIASSKRISLLRDALPGAKAVGLLYAPNPLDDSELTNARSACEAIGAKAIRLDVTAREDLERHFAELRRGGVDAVSVLTTPVLFDNLQLVAQLAMRHRVPSIAAYRAFAGLGGLMSYTADAADLISSTVALAAKLLNGVQPADLPVQQAKKFDLTLNVKTAAAIGLSVSQALKVQAQQMIS